MIVQWFDSVCRLKILKESTEEKQIWGSLSLPSRSKPDLGLLRTFGVDLRTSPGGAAVDAPRCAWDLWESNPR